MSNWVEPGSGPHRGGPGFGRGTDGYLVGERITDIAAWAEVGKRFIEVNRPGVHNLCQVVRIGNGFDDGIVFASFVRPPDDGREMAVMNELGQRYEAVAPPPTLTTAHDNPFTELVAALYRKSSELRGGNGYTNAAARAYADAAQMLDDAIDKHNESELAKA